MNGHNYFYIPSNIVNRGIIKGWGLFQKIYLYHIKGVNLMSQYNHNFTYQGLRLVFFYHLYNLDLQGPKITSVSGTPMVDGRDINLICSAISTLDIGLEWKCLNVASPKEERKNETYIFITLTLNINRTYNGKECSCICKYNNFTSVQTVILHIASK